MISQEEILAYVQARKQLDEWRDSITARYKTGEKQEEGLYGVVESERRSIAWKKEWIKICEQNDIDPDYKELEIKKATPKKKSYTITKLPNTLALKERLEGSA